MNYYDEILDKLENLIKNKNYDEAKSIIYTELNVPYVAKDFEDKLNHYLSIIKENSFNVKLISDEEIEDCLYKEPNYQLIAVDELNKKNLRDYIDICDKYLKSNGFKNAKVLLIDSLIRQEINYKFTYVNDSLLLEFNPKELKTIEETEGFISANKQIEDFYYKDPSKYKMAIELLYKETLMYLPKQANTNEGIICANKIINYIEDAFNAKEVIK